MLQTFSQKIVAEYRIKLVNNLICKRTLNLSPTTRLNLIVKSHDSASVARNEGLQLGRHYTFVRNPVLANDPVKKLAIKKKQKKDIFGLFQHNQVILSLKEQFSDAMIYFLIINKPIAFNEFTRQSKTKVSLTCILVKIKNYTIFRILLL